MTKRDLVVRISKETGIIQEDVFTVLQKSLDYVADALVEGEHVEFRDFGVFDVCLRKARVGRNPKTGEVVEVEPKRLPFFRSGKELKEFLNQ